MTKIRPFVKWAGGKGKLLPTLVANLPVDFRNREAITYIEPFVGGGAMLFYMLENYPNINRAIINDINPALINCYNRIKNNHVRLIRELKSIQNAYYNIKTQEGRRSLYYNLREEYNQLPSRRSYRAAALFIFFNKTCFNGLYRENSKGKFNVPFGRYVRPTICNESVIKAAHEALQNVEILLGNYTNVREYINWNEYTFFYFDPPYRPLLGANNFKEYTLNSFGDPEQVAPRDFCNEVHANGGHFILSNSDSELEEGISYFEELYGQYNVQHIFAPRAINAFVPGIETATEVLVKNF